MANVKKCRINPAAANRLRNSSAIQSDLLARGKSIAQAASASTPHSESTMHNPDYIVKVREGKMRASAAVIAANPDSIIDNRKRNTLLKSLDAGR